MPQNRNRTETLMVRMFPHEKASFVAICKKEKRTPSEVVRRLIDKYIEMQKELGKV